ncbi:MAG: hypothetical protein H6618_09445 [Deltaproteobacteria bacterium]|nr:hypothetical protein [Deltaproteobacteria bacterium]
MEQLSVWILSQLSAHPYFAIAISGVGTARLLIPPVINLLKAAVNATATKKDDELLDQALSSAAWNNTLNVMEWLTSIKDIQKLRK